MSSSYYSCCSRCSHNNNNTPSVSIKQSSTNKISAIIKRILKSMLFCTHRKKPDTSCSCKSSIESITVVDEQQAWIVPPEYHKSKSGNKRVYLFLFYFILFYFIFVWQTIDYTNLDNHWIFRTGWTPQPDPLATLDSGWCSQCHACVKKSLGYCSACQSSPLVLSQQRLPRTPEEEKEI
jgi:uncharacterized paraquat-inducible protein A